MFIFFIFLENVETMCKKMCSLVGFPKCELGLIKNVDIFFFSSVSVEKSYHNFF